jgi:2-polyprenyl-3-methyl-5-hydroxy-6-metoxy-1,4-benzoquinol methylase
VFADRIKDGYELYKDMYQESDGYQFYIREFGDMRSLIKSLGWPYKRFLAEIDRFVSPGVKILEVGCGVGYFVYVLNQLGYDASGCDVSRYAVNLGRKRFGVELYDKELSGDVAQPGTLDVVVAFELIEHLAAPYEWLCAANRALKEKGCVVLSTPNLDSGWPLAWKSTRTVLPPVHWMIFNERSLSALAARCGFRIIRIAQKPVPWRYEYQEYGLGFWGLFIRLPYNILMNKKGVTLFCVMEKIQENETYCS